MEQQLWVAHHLADHAFQDIDLLRRAPAAQIVLRLFPVHELEGRQEGEIVDREDDDTWRKIFESLQHPAEIPHHKDSIRRVVKTGRAKHGTSPLIGPRGAERQNSGLRLRTASSFSRYVWSENCGRKTNGSPRVWSHATNLTGNSSPEDRPINVAASPIKTSGDRNSASRSQNRFMAVVNERAGSELEIDELLNIWRGLMKMHDHCLEDTSDRSVISHPAQPRRQQGKILAPHQKQIVSHY